MGTARTAGKFSEKLFCRKIVQQKCKIFVSKPARKVKFGVKLKFGATGIIFFVEKLQISVRKLHLLASFAFYARELA